MVKDGLNHLKPSLNTGSSHDFVAPAIRSRLRTTPLPGRRELPRGTEVFAALGAVRDSGGGVLGRDDGCF